MVQSMTGYGRGEIQEDEFSFVVEIKTVNHRYTELAMRLPKFLNPLENRIRQQILERIGRGRVDVFITSTYTGSGAKRLKIDKGLAKAYYDSLKELDGLLQPSAEDLHPDVYDTLQELGVDHQVFLHPEAIGKVPDRTKALYFIAGCPDVLVAEEGDIDVDALWPKIRQAVDTALTHLTDMRLTEGANIAKDIAKRIGYIGEMRAAIEKRAPETVKEYEKRLRERIQELLTEAGQGPLDPMRLIQETAIYADRVSITEELVRLSSHLHQFQLLLAEEKPVGRRMDFLVQEMNREANTIASKAGDAQIVQTIVNMKAEIEKVREQIQNIQ